MKELFCIGDDNYKLNMAYVIGLSKDKLYSHFLQGYGVIYVESAINGACKYEHFTDAKIAIHGLAKNTGIQEAKNYKIYKITCDIAECENYVNDEGE